MNVRRSFRDDIILLECLVDVSPCVGAPSARGRRERGGRRRREIESELTQAEKCSHLDR